MKYQLLKKYTLETRELQKEMNELALEGWSVHSFRVEDGNFYVLMERE